MQEGRSFQRIGVLWGGKLSSFRGEVGTFMENEKSSHRNIIIFTLQMPRKFSSKIKIANCIFLTVFRIVCAASAI